MKQTENLQLPILQSGDKYTKETQNEAFKKVDLHLGGLAKRVNNIVASGGESNIEIVDARVDNITGVVHNTIGERINSVSEQLETNARDLNNKIKEVSEKGTTVDVIEKATKKEVERQINDGTMALLTIEDKSLTNEKIKNKSINFDLLDEDIQQKTKQLTIIGEDIEYNAGFVKYNGQIDQVGSYAYKKIPMITGETLYITTNCYGGNGALAVFMDKNDRFISNYKRVSEVGGKNYIDEPIIAPSNTSYVLIGTGNRTNYPITIKKYSFIDVLDMKVNLGDMKVNLDEINNVTNNLKTTSLKEIYSDIEYNKGFVKYDGRIDQVGNYAYKKIPMLVGETLYITTNCFGGNGALAVFIDKNNRFISYYKRVSEVGGKNYVDEPIVAPNNTSYALIGTGNKDTYPITIKKYNDVFLTYEEFLSLKNNCITQEKYDEVLYEKNQVEERLISVDNLINFAWKTFDKGYVTVVIDDGRHDLCEILQVFKDYNAPLSCALISNNLNSLQDDGRKLIDVALDIQSNGGEILSHSTSSSVFTETTTEEEANKRLRNSKKILADNGLIVNGFVKPGGTGALATLGKFEHLVKKYYRYGYSAGNSEPYSKGRYTLNDTLDVLKSKVDFAKNYKARIIFYGHALDDDIDKDKLKALLQYINDNDGVEIVTTKYLYDTFATTTLENRILALENK